jgi:cold shock CspA family protein
MTGKIARVISDKGFGFIYCNGKDYFFHRSACSEFDQLQGGEEVSFEEDLSNRKGPRAEYVTLLEKE